MLIALWLTSLVLGGVGAWLIGHYGSRYGLTDEPNERSSHKEPTPKGGGIGILAAFLFASIVVCIPLFFWLPAGILAVLSFLGDKLDFSAKSRLAFQFTAAAFVVAGTGLLELSLVNEMILFIPMVIFIVGSANIYNFMDGINGIAAITGIIGFSLVGFYNFLSNGDASFTVLSVCVLMSCLGFLPFNMPRARVFMGDVGSVLLGFVFAGVVIALSRDLLDFICLSSFLLTFYADELNTMIVRIRNGENLFHAHRKHIYQLLANEKGIPHWKVSVGYGLFQTVVGLSVLGVKPLGLTPVIVLLAVWFSGFFLFSSFVRRGVAQPV
jgi:UDP-N-acetylmuramyl pentapeptide phosphotransferase/UDP-N-acetylglucosamine-1-phosphate transferase